MKDDKLIIENNTIIDNTFISEDDKVDPGTYSATLNQDGTVDIEDLTPDIGDTDPSGYSALRAVQHALSKEPLEFENMVKVGLADRLQNAVDQRREEIAQSIFNNEDEEIGDDDNDADDNNASEDEEVNTDPEDQSEE